MLLTFLVVFDENYSVLGKSKQGEFIIDLVQVLGNTAYHGYLVYRPTLVFAKLVLVKFRIHVRSD